MLSLGAHTYRHSILTGVIYTVERLAELAGSALRHITNGGEKPREIAHRPARVLMQDFTGVPAVVALAAMRDGIKALGGDPQKINPLNPVDLVIDHSVMIDRF